MTKFLKMTKITEQKLT